jgi:MEMO1 family protein
LDIRNSFMSLVFSAIVPHPPLLLPSIGREHAKMLEKTSESYGKISASLALSGAETIVVISPHLPFLPENFLINFSPIYRTHFVEFGDFSKPRSFQPDHLLIERIKRNAREKEYPLILINEEHLDYGSGVPLFFLPNDNLKTKIIVVGPSNDDAKTQFAFGRIIKDAILRSRHKVAVICSGDLSHRHSSDSPSGFSKQAKIFDEMMIANLSAGNASPILQTDEILVSEAHACGYKPICLFLGIMDKINCRPELLSYEIPFGVGYATMEFHLL